LQGILKFIDLRVLPSSSVVQNSAHPKIMFAQHFIFALKFCYQTPKKRGCETANNGNIRAWALQRMSSGLYIRSVFPPVWWLALFLRSNTVLK